MWGGRGSERRRRLIRVEFLVGTAGCIALGGFSVLSGSGWQLVLGVWLIGVGVNYLPLALHAHSLSRPGALQAELEGADLPRELRRAGVRQVWIAVPFPVAITALMQTRQQPRRQ
jgi:tellurite resistance protein TehA-like permease